MIRHKKLAKTNDSQHYSIRCETIEDVVKFEKALSKISKEITFEEEANMWAKAFGCKATNTRKN